MYQPPFTQRHTFSNLTHNGRTNITFFIPESDGKMIGTKAGAVGTECLTMAPNHTRRQKERHTNCVRKVAQLPESSC